MKNKRTQSKAFTRVDLVFTVATIGLLAALFGSAQEDLDARFRRDRIICVNNLKQVGLAFRIWSNDNGDKFPMQVTARKGGSLEACTNGEAFRHFAVMSQELNRTKILVCPSDDREVAPSFDELQNTNVSYFVGLGANEAKPQTILSGDRNITNGLPRPLGVLGLEPDRPAGWTAEIHVEKGNLGLADGSVQQVNTPMLRRQIEENLRFGGAAAKRLQFPE